MKNLFSEPLHLGIDIGSISINTVLINNKLEIVYENYSYCQGKPFMVVLEVLKEFERKYGLHSFSTASFTGSGGKQAAEIMGGVFVNEVIAQSYSTSVLYGNIRSVIEIGGEDSKLIQLDNGENIKTSRLSDFALNSLCAAGTGSFLDQQAKRIGINIEDEFGALAEKSANPPRIAGRCSVFAKSDMIHLQQVATPLHDIVAGLCFAVARNFKSTLGRGRKIEKPVAFQGGVAANTGMRRAIREVFGLSDGDLIIPEHYASMGAIGAVFHTLGDEHSPNPYLGISGLEKYIKSGKGKTQRLKQLVESSAVYNKQITQLPPGTDLHDVYLGLDVGSLSTNIVLIDNDNNVIARRYLPTASKPLDAIRQGLKEINNEAGKRIRVRAAGTTGSGRYLTGDFIGADTIVNEITAQARAAIAYDRKVDTIFEIGGQDSKYISIKDGVVVDFEMNKVCAAGTGSFLEEQAEKLGINIKEEFGKLALEAKKPARLGDRCTVFMESDLNSHQQKGVALNDLLGGLAYSIVQNYIQKVVGEKPIGDNIFFQGGVTNNKSVVAAFELITGRKITIPPHFDVTGAIGAAILAREQMDGTGKSGFKGFDISNKTYSVKRFTCQSCSNNCEIQSVKIEGDKKALFYGGRCEKYEKEERKKKNNNIPDLFKERNSMLLGDYKDTADTDMPIIGIPRALMIFYQQFPFWRNFFEELGFRVIISDPSDNKLVRESIELMVSETCMPVELMHGHIKNLIDKDVDNIFIPFIVNARADKGNPTNNCNCPWVQAAPFMIKSAFKDEKIRQKLLMPSLHFRHYKTALKKELGTFMKDKFGISPSRTWKAILKADRVQDQFEESLRSRGKEILEHNFGSEIQKVVVLGRPYNTGDPLLNLSLIDKLINLNTLPVPVDFLTMDQKDVFEDYPMMYWPNGQKLIAASKLVRRSEDLYAVYLSNFRCGPDSFISHFVRHEMKGKPYLHLEVDEHSAGAGMITRCEAFLDSLKGYKKSRHTKDSAIDKKSVPNNLLDGRTLYYPYANDVVHVLAAATRHIGIKSEVLPMQDEEDLEIAQRHTSGQECFPMICTTGSFLKKLMQPGCDPSRASFFMPDHNGPCRFGDYNKLQRQIFDKLGFHEASLVTPGNDNAYAELTKDHAGKFRRIAWLGANGVDVLRKYKQEIRPYEINKGDTNRIYDEQLKRLINIVEVGAQGIPAFLNDAGRIFSQIPVNGKERKPVIAIVGEIFMRDNPYCSAFLVNRLEALGAETMVPRFCEWLHYSTYRYTRDSRWKGDRAGIIKSKIQKMYQHYTFNRMTKAADDYVKLKDYFTINDLIRGSAPYIHKDYDGEPVVALGSASSLSKINISGVVYILPFTCMPGTIVASVSGDFKKDHNNIPWLNFAYDGQEDASIETHLQAFMHQAHEYNKENKYHTVRS
ncbi:MAG: acyl-CoA dehydratase activase [Bacteroidales bacterium]|nr:acyl-CoA dehydratase activase [Bacteroidales bacterium]